FVPGSVFGLPDDQIALFLHHLWATDGSIALCRNSRGRYVHSYYASTSRRLAEDVRQLLLRLDIDARVSRARKNGYRDSWHTTVSGAADLTRFLTSVGAYGARGDCISEALEILDAINENPNVDLIPWDVADRV